MSSHVKFCLLIAGLSAALGACTTLRVTTDVNPNFSVSNCHTYAFASEHSGGADAAFSNPLNGDRLRAAIEGNMAARGVTKAADMAAADCVVGYALGTRQVFNDYYAGWGVGWGYGGGYGWGRRGWGGGWGYDGPWVEDETRIVVDVFDARAHRAIWHGRGERDDLGSEGAERRSQDQRRHRRDIREAADRQPASRAGASELTAGPCRSNRNRTPTARPS